RDSPPRADWLDSFWSGLRGEDQWAAFVTEGAAHLVGEGFLVLGREEFVAVDEEEKGGRGPFHLRGIKEFKASAVGRGGLAALESILKGAMENRGGDFLLQLGSDVTHGFEQVVEMKAGLSRGENDGSIVEKEEVLLNPLAELGQGGHK